MQAKKWKRFFQKRIYALIAAMCAVAILAAVVDVATHAALNACGKRENHRRTEEVCDQLRECATGGLQRVRQAADAWQESFLDQEIQAPLLTEGGEIWAAAEETMIWSVAEDPALSQAVESTLQQGKILLEVSGEETVFFLLPEDSPLACAAVGWVPHQQVVLIWGLDRVSFGRLLQPRSGEDILITQGETVAYSTIAQGQEMPDVWSAETKPVMELGGERCAVSTATAMGETRVMLLRSLAPLENMAAMVRTGTLAAAGVLLALLGTLTVLEARRISASTRRLSTVLDQCRRMDLSFTAPEDPDEELSLFYETLNLVMEKVRSLVEHNRQLAECRTQIEVKQLQGQFNPHFVFNLLANLQYMIHTNPEKAGKLVTGLSRLLKYSIENGRIRVPLETDLRHMENYLMLQKSRYGARLDYEFHVDPEAERCQIPKLLIQPLVENAIVHNIDKTDYLKIDLFAYKEGEQLQLMVQDNGCGIPPGELSSLRDQLKNDGGMDNHIGLFNVHRTVQLEYGEQYGMDLHSIYSKGTVITIVLPFTEGGDADV